VKAVAKPAAKPAPKAAPVKAVAKPAAKPAPKAAPVKPVAKLAPKAVPAKAVAKTASKKAIPSVVNQPIVSEEKDASPVAKIVPQAAPKQTPVAVAKAPVVVHRIHSAAKPVIEAKIVNTEPVKMSPEDLAYFEKLLIEKRSTLVQELDAIEESNLSRSQTDQGGELSGYTNHLADAASDYTALETNLELAERESKYLIYIEEALERVHRGTYGICKSCLFLIPKGRLEAVPTATKCVNCKQDTKKREVVEKQHEMARVFAREAARKS
jgi:DnaK suppressor protein